MEAVPMPVSSILKKMIGFSQGNLHDINHFLKVYAYAKTIGELEGVDPETQLILEELFTNISYYSYPEEKEDNYCQSLY
jgi:hypothetical protein